MEIAIIIAKILAYVIACAVIDHWVGGAGLFRGEKSRKAKEVDGIESALWDRRAYPFAAFFVITEALFISTLGLTWISALAPVAITAGYVYFRQRSHNPVFYAIHGDPRTSKGNGIVNAVVAAFTKHTPELAPDMTEDERFEFGTTWGGFYGFLGLVPGATVISALIAWPAAALPVFGIPFGIFHKIFGERGRWPNPAFARSYAELCAGGLIVAPFSVVVLLLIRFGFQGLIC